MSSRETNMFKDIENLIGEPAEPFYWFRVGGRKVFPIYGSTGAVCAGAMLVLCDNTRPMALLPLNTDLRRHGFHEQNGAAWYVVELQPFFDLDSLGPQLAAAGKAMGAPEEWLYPPKPRR